MRNVTLRDYNSAYSENLSNLTGVNTKEAPLVPKAKTKAELLNDNNTTEEPGVAECKPAYTVVGKGKESKRTLRLSLFLRQVRQSEVGVR